MPERRTIPIAAVRPGLRSAAVGRRDPDAVRHRRSWWLATAELGSGDGKPTPVLRATVRHGRVDALVGYIGGAGE